MRLGRVTLSLIVGAIVASYLFCPKPQLEIDAGSSRAFFDRNGELLRISLAADQRYRLATRLDDINKDLIEATLLYEDKHFYRHFGVDFVALFRAFWTTYISGQRRIGASTIDMQVARLLWNIPSKTIKGKIKQILRALQLSRHYSKDEVLALYLNHAPYGGNIEGIGAASLIYFNKTPDRLSLPEVLTLAVIPQNPSKRNPTSEAGFQQLLTARQNLFERWLEDHPQDSSQAKFLQLPLNIRSTRQLPFKAPHFVEYVDRQIPRFTSSRIDTTLDSVKQSRIEKITSAYLASRQDRGFDNASVLLLNYETMSIEAMLGSADYFDADIQGQVNGSNAKRSPGSALKPFVYALAMDEGLIHPLSLLKDSPQRFGGFTPENYDKQFVGPISVTDALITSRNVPAVDLQSKLKSRSFHQFLQEANVDELKQASFYGLALALGGGEVTMLELAGLYAMLANQGLWQPIQFIDNNPVKKSRRLISPEASFLTLDILRQNPPPNQLQLKPDQARVNDVAWKTGTSWAFRDAWAVGVSGPYILAVWLGHFDGQGNDNLIGRHAAGPLLFSLFDTIFPAQGWRLKDSQNLENLDLKWVKVCASTGDLYTKLCPSAALSWFIPGVSPIAVSNIYRKVAIDLKSGLRACRFQAGQTRMQVFEFWPSDFLKIFRQAGVSLKTPPRYQSDCVLDQKSIDGQIPMISSPQSSVEYILQVESKQPLQIPLSATVDSDALMLYWFIDGKFIGSVDSQKTLFWHAKPGRFEARVVDDSGRAASKNFVVNQVN